MSDALTYPLPDSGSEPPRPSGRRTTAIAAVTAATLVVVGGGAFAAVHFLSGGDDAEQALPASAVAVASINLDPGAQQKVEALKTLRKFPALRKQLGLRSTGDLRKAFVDQALKDSPCRTLSYDKDFEPWVGDSAAVAAVPFSAKQVTPVVALAVSDEKKAAATFTDLNACSKTKDKVAWAFSDGFALLSDTQAHADAAVKQAKANPLADDTGYQEWSGKAGDRGIVNFYVAKQAASYLADKAGSLVPDNSFPSDLPSSELSGSGSGSGASAPYARGDGSGEKLKNALKSFQGAAGAVRFADGGMELEVVGGGLPASKVSTDGGRLVAALPKDTAAAVGVGVPSDFASKLVKNLGDLDIPFLGNGDDVVSQLETQLGLSLPGDLQTVLGKGVAVSLGGKAPSSLSDIGSPADLPAAVSIAGADVGQVKAVIAKLGGAGSQVVTKGDGKVVVSFDSDYAKELASNGDLGDQKRFTTVVPHADDAQFVAYVDLDSDWAATIAATNTDAKDNLGPLQAVGLSVWRDGSTSHLLLKVTTD